MKYTKKLALLLTAALLLVAFAGCSEKAPSSSSQQAETQPEQSEESAEVAEVVEPVTLNFWHHYSAQSAESETLMNVLIPQFESENPGIKVNAVSHEWAELHDKILVSANANSLPDVARCDIAWLPEFQKMGVLVALDQEMPNFAEVSDKLLDSAEKKIVKLAKGPEGEPVESEFDLGE